MSKPVTCSLCGQEWPRDPRLEVPCPSCRARIGSPCERPSGHRAAEIHIEREQKAVDEGFLSKECPGAPRDVQAAQIELFA
jgi:hypothetical protein